MAAASQVLNSPELLDIIIGYVFLRDDKPHRSPFGRKRALIRVNRLWFHTIVRNLGLRATNLTIKSYIHHKRRPRVFPYLSAIQTVELRGPYPSYEEHATFLTESRELLSKTPMRNLKSLALIDFLPDDGLTWSDVTIFLPPTLRSITYKALRSSAELWIHLEQYCPGLTKLQVQGSGRLKQKTVDPYEQDGPKDVTLAFCRFLRSTSCLVDLSIEGHVDIMGRTAFGEMVAKTSLRHLKIERIDRLEIMPKLESIPDSHVPSSNISVLEIEVREECVERILVPFCKNLKSLTMRMVLTVRRQPSSLRLPPMLKLEKLVIHAPRSVHDWISRDEYLEEIARGCPKLQVLELGGPESCNFGEHITNNGIKALAQALPDLQSIILKASRGKNTEESILYLGRYCPNLKFMHLSGKFDYAKLADTAESMMFPQLQQMKLHSTQRSRRKLALTRKPTYEIDSDGEEYEIEPESPSRPRQPSARALKLYAMLPACRKFLCEDAELREDVGVLILRCHGYTRAPIS